jgi:hypothetical protein
MKDEKLDPLGFYDDLHEPAAVATNGHSLKAEVKDEPSDAESGRDDSGSPSSPRANGKRAKVEDEDDKPAFIWDLREALAEVSAPSGPSIGSRG